MRCTIRRALVGISLILSLASPVLAGQLHPAVDSAAPPTWVKASVLPSTPNPPVEHASGQHFLLYDRQLNLETKQTFIRRVFQIVSDEGRRDGAQVQVTFDPSYQKVAIHHLRVRRGEEVIERLNLGTAQLLQRERDLDRQLYIGELSVLHILEDVRVGDVIDVAYTIEGFNPVFGDRFSDVMNVGWGIPMKSQHYRIVAPADRSLHNKIQGVSGVASSVATMHDGSREYSWTSADLTPIEYEESTPSWVTVYPYLEVSEFRDWTEVAEWAVALYSAEPSDATLLNEAADRLAASSSDLEGRIVAALRFVQEEIRYLGIEMGAGSHRPHAPDEVLRRRFGDCKDKALLLTTLVRKLGGEAAAALVHSTRSKALAQALPSPFAFDHVVVEVRLGDQVYLIDPTMSYQRGSTLQQRHVGGFASYLRIADGVRGLSAVAIGPWDATSIDIVERYELPAFDQRATLVVTTKYAGRSADSQRSYFATTPRDQIARAYLNFYTRFHQDVRTATALELRDDPERNEIEVVEHYTIGSLFTPMPNSTTIRAEFHPAVVDQYIRPNNVAARRFPLYVTHPAHISQAITVQLPEYWPEVDQRMAISDPAFLLKTSNRTSEKTVQLKYEWLTVTDHVLPARLGDFTGKVREALDQLGYQLTWNAAATGVAGNALNWPMLLLAVGVVVSSSYFSWSMVRRKNPSPIAALPAPAPAEPYGRRQSGLVGIGGWLLLVAFGVVLRPFLYFASLAGTWSVYFDHGTWHLLTSPDSASYHALYAPLLASELVVNITLIVVSIAMIPLFFRHSHLFPRVIQWFLGVQVLVAAYSIWASSVLPSQAPQEAHEAGRELAKAIGAAAVWIPYFSMSRRVKATFIR